MLVDLSLDLQAEHLGAVATELSAVLCQPCVHAIVIESSLDKTLGSALWDELSDAAHGSLINKHRQGDPQQLST